ncbi:MAG TPA: phosphoribosylanthranilate isomerase [Pyrinomonadaceae bacterium]|jgi:phosphoribosylanthranilate isomerase|nr:phosphoribosylanthranilate isomerase [Pyrinomonadaceae bacterium]
MTLVKICGITNLDDALAAVGAGADALGFNFYSLSPRYITPQHAREIIEQLPESLLTVGVFVNEDSEAVRVIAEEAGLGALQLHGDESPEYCRELDEYFVIKTFAVADTFDIQAAYEYEVEAIMLDTKHDQMRGGTGRVFDWSVAQQLSQTDPKLFLAGGLSPENVQNAVEIVRPFAVDACSALEDRPGKKNHERMRVFINTVRGVAP